MRHSPFGAPPTRILSKTSSLLNAYLGLLQREFTQPQGINLRWWALTPPLPPTDLCPVNAFLQGAIGRVFAMHLSSHHCALFNQAVCSVQP